MQIEVVDDCSKDDTAFEMSRRLGAGRVTFHRESKNRALANAWNRCIERARGHWVHILHQDDIVLPGFYDVLRKRAERSHAGAIFCRHAIANSNGHWIRISELHRESPGLLDDWHEMIAVEQLIQCPAIVVQRAVYERLGGFIRNWLILQTGKCGSGLPPTIRFGSSPPYSLVTGCTAPRLLPDSCRPTTYATCD
jgi:glycosyltransferase involved in cell wall biosynthesis